MNDVNNAFNLHNWSEGYVSISQDGELLIRPNRQSSQTLSLSRLLKDLRTQGLRTPVLVRFKDILHDRVNAICHAFQQAAIKNHYTGRYRLVYPIKVNQQRRVVEEILLAEPARSAGQIGLEAGSKAELLAVMALAPDTHTTLICNGYKDQEYVEIALRGQQLGFRVFLVVEKLSELELILRVSNTTGIKPLLGIRARLASIGKGNWQNTGGEKSKFGLSAQQILTALNTLKQHHSLSCLQLLHFHLGSQIANIRDLQKGMQECARFYSQLIAMGAPINTVDVGGGLSVDYDGTRSRSYCSMNYSMEDYAQHVLLALKEVCDESGIAHPDIISESGRAISAHHAVLITDIIDIEHLEMPNIDDQTHLDSEQPSATQHLLRDYQYLVAKDQQRSLIEVYHDAAHAYDEIQSLFLHGNITLEQKAFAEQIYLASCKLLQQELQPSNMESQAIKDELDRKLADKLFTNVSVFQSLPDVWGINQIFPIMPIKYLHMPLDRQVIIQDITCDSDGRIDHYVSHQGIESTLALPAAAATKNQALCFFLVGAYQEILGDMHNLFGDTDSIDVSLNHNDEWILEHAIRGDTVASVLEYVNLAPNYLLGKYQQLLDRSNISGEEKVRHLRAFETSLAGYTYLAHEPTPTHASVHRQS